MELFDKNGNPVNVATVIEQVILEQIEDTNNRAGFQKVEPHDQVCLTIKCTRKGKRRIEAFVLREESTGYDAAAKLSKIEYIGFVMEISEK